MCHFSFTHFSQSAYDPHTQINGASLVLIKAWWKKLAFKFSVNIKFVIREYRIHFKVRIMVDVHLYRIVNHITCPNSN